MMKITLIVAAAAAVLTSAPLVSPANAQSVKMAQVDVEIGRDRDDRYDRDRRRRPRRRHHWPATALPHGDDHGRTARPHRHAPGASLRLAGAQAFWSLEPIPLPVQAGAVRRQATRGGVWRAISA